MRIGIIGAGMIGSTLAKLWSEAGHEVRLASRHPEHLKDLVAHLGTLVSAGTPMDAAEFGDVVMLTVPLLRSRDRRTTRPGKRLRTEQPALQHRYEWLPTAGALQSAGVTT